MKETLIEGTLETKEMFFKSITMAKQKSISSRTKTASEATYIIKLNKVVQYKQEGYAAFRLFVHLLIILVQDLIYKN